MLDAHSNINALVYFFVGQLEKVHFSKHNKYLCVSIIRCVRIIMSYFIALKLDMLLQFLSFAIAELASYTRAIFAENTLMHA